MFITLYGIITGSPPAYKEAVPEDNFVVRNMFVCLPVVNGRVVVVAGNFMNVFGSEIGNRFVSSGSFVPRDSVALISRRIFFKT